MYGASTGGFKRRAQVMAKRVVLVRHGDDPPDDRVYTCLATNGFEPVTRRPFAGDLLCEPDGIVGTVIMATDTKPKRRTFHCARAARDEGCFLLCCSRPASSWR
jgi:hypothetical protein